MSMGEALIEAIPDMEERRTQARARSDQAMADSGVAGVVHQARQPVPVCLQGLGQERWDADAGPLLCWSSP